MASDPPRDPAPAPDRADATSSGPPPVVLPIVLEPVPHGAPPTSPRAPIHLEGRLHPFTLLFAGWNAVRGFLIPVVALFVFGRATAAGVLLLLPLAITFFVGLIRYFTYTYRLEAGELITCQGILNRTERHIPLERVQDVRIEQGVLHRLVGVVDVHIETAGGQGPEASLSVLARAEADRLRQAVFGRDRPVADAAAASTSDTVTPQLIRKLRTWELVLAGLTSNRIASALVIVGVLWGLADDVLPEDYYDRIGESIMSASRSLMERGTIHALMVVVAGVFAVLFACVCFSVIGSVVLFHGFTLNRLGEDLHRSYGLFTRRSSSLPRRRIQVLEIEEGMLRRLLNLATLRADTAGGGEQGGETRSGRDVLLPVVPRHEVPALVPIFFPDFQADDADWQRASRKAIRRGTLRGSALVLVLLAGALLLHRHWIGLWPCALFPVVYYVSRKAYHHLGYALGRGYFRTRRGWLGRSTHIVPIRNSQTVVLRETPFDRRLGLATLIVDTAGQAYTGGGPRIGNVPREEAYELARTLARQAAETRFRW